MKKKSFMLLCNIIGKEFNFRICSFSIIYIRIYPLYVRKWIENDNLTRVYRGIYWLKTQYSFDSKCK